MPYRRWAPLGLSEELPTVVLVRNAHTFPNDSGIASGLIMKRDDGQLLLLTAGHSFSRSGAWTLDTGLSVGGTTLHAPIQDLQLLASLNLATGEVAPVDLAWGWIESAGIRQELANKPSFKGMSVELPVYQGSLTAVPSPDHAYGYASWNRVEFHATVGTLAVDPSYEVGMTFLGTNSDSGLYEFELDRLHQGHSYYEGASGAPIADETGQIVSMLLAGDRNRNILLGAPLARYASILGLGRDAEP
jgi:hypothetical protein